jgi:hypothetical protein
MGTFLLPQYESLLNHRSAKFTWENAVELMCDEKQRNLENPNFKSVASTGAGSVANTLSYFAMGPLVSSPGSRLKT